ncbi:MAG: DUF2779 domain-containing protein [Erysipelotrichaceae bacterium]|nr:DUF2779 domain-containing protein [Erysipelotrichaceae bacterium]
MIHISDVNNYLQCKHLYLKTLSSDKPKFQQFIHKDETLSLIGTRKLGIKEAFFGQRGDPNEAAFAAMKEFEWLIKARFEYMELRVKIPFMHHNGKAWDIYFIRNELFPKEDNLMYMTDTLWVLRQLGITLGAIYILHFNSTYQRQGDLDYDQLLTISEYLYNQNNHPSVHLTDAVTARTRDLTKIIEHMRTLNRESLPPVKREKKCSGRFQCRFYTECFPEEQNVPDNSILHLLGCEYKHQMFNDGKLYLRDSDLDLIEGTRQQYAQIMADRNNGLFVDKMNLKLWLNDHLTFPLSFLDFEWDRYGIPPYDQMKPFDVLLFQYSLHVYDHELRHREFIGLEDCRRELLESLLNDLPPSGSVIVFNASGGEEIRLRELQVIYPEYSAQIDDIISRMVDFSIPFNLGMVYHLKMRGSYSLKRIVEVIDDKLSYHNLDIPQALDAVDGWRKLSKSISDEEEKKLIADLLAYCAMDTYSLYLIYRWFMELCQMEVN